MSVMFEKLRLTYRILWVPTIGLFVIHIAALYGFYLSIVSVKWQTLIVVYMLGIITNIGTITAAHRYGTHRSFKANKKLKMILSIIQTMSGQKSMVEWARDHHTHHKYEGTDADVVNINRGFFFAHIGWLLIKRHPKCKEKRDASDVNNLILDPIFKFQYDFYAPLVLIFCVIIPTIIPCCLFSETITNGFFTCFALRYIYILQTALCGNSVAHIWGYKIYDRNLSATRNTTLNYFSMGAAYHNYHHAFPYDYSASEYGWKSNININTSFIDFFAMIGWAYDLKTAPQEVIRQRQLRTGNNIRDLWKQNAILETILAMISGANILLIVIPIRNMI